MVNVMLAEEKHSFVARSLIIRLECELAEIGFKQNLLQPLHK